MKSHRLFPEPQTGYELNPRKGFFGIILPKEVTNLCKEPSWEDGINNEWNGVNCGIVATHGDDTTSRRGMYVLQISTATPSNRHGARYTFSADLPDGTYSGSIDLLGYPGAKYRLQWQTNGNANIAYKEYIATGFWQRPSVIASGSTLRKFYVSVEPNALAPSTEWYIDGVLLEEGLPSTYFDGDNVGFVPTRKDFRWNGQPYESTSWRSGKTRAGGRIIPFDTLGISILSFSGLGEMDWDHVTFPRPLVGGENFQRSIPQARQYTIVGAITGKKLMLLSEDTSRVAELLGAHNVAGDQPLSVFFQYYDCEREISHRALLPSLYNGGLDGNRDNLYQERVSISFIMPSPYIEEDGQEGSVPDTSAGTSPLGASEYVAMRDGATGQWHDMDGGVDGAVYAIREIPADGDYGKVWFGGNFTNVGTPLVAANRLASYDRENDEWAAIGAGLNNIVRTILPGLNPRYVYIGGDFDDVQGGPGGTYNYIVQWDLNTSTFNALGGGLPSACRDLAWGADGTLYAVGNFGLQGWDGAAWNSIGTVAGIGGNVRTLAIDTNGDIYTGGSFNTVNPGAVSALNIAVYDGTNWAQVGSGLGSYVDDLLFGNDGLLYMSGGFIADGDGNAILHVGAWNGTKFISLGNWNAGSGADVFSITQIDSLLYAAGYGVVNAGGITDADYLAVWNGVAWGCVDIQFDTTGWPAPPNLGPRVIASDSRNNLFVGLLSATGGTGTLAAGETILTNTGKAPTYPVFRVTTTNGEDLRFLTIRNITTDQEIWFNNLTINQDEYVYVDFRPGHKKIYSNIRGDLSYTIVPGSDFGTFELKPGDNYVSAFVRADPTASGRTFGVYWPIRHLSVENLSYLAGGTNILDAQV